MNQKFVVVTGASKGIGRATAIRLAEAGFVVFAGVRKVEDGDALKREHLNIRPILIDVTDAKLIAAAAATVSAQVDGNGLYGLINNAGINIPAPLEFLPITQFREQMEVNLFGQLAVTQAFLPCLRHAHGRIINISSYGGRIASPGMGAYHASKFALEGLSDTLRQELSPWGIEVVVIEPGIIATPIWETSMQAWNRLHGQLSPQVTELYGKVIAEKVAWAERSAKNAVPPDKVAQVIEKALKARKPHTRYTVSTNGDAFIGVHIIAKLPDRLRDRIIGSM